MSYYKIHSDTLTEIADAIRAQSGSAASIKPTEMAKAISELQGGYVVSEPINVLVPAADWDNSNCSVKITGYKIGNDKLTLGVPADCSNINMSNLIQSAITIQRTSVTNPDTSNNTAGYVNATLVAVNPPNKDLLIAFFGLEEVEAVKVTQTAITGLTAPVTGAARDLTNLDNTQFTGTKSWSPSDSTYAASTTYTLTLTLTPKKGYTFTGITSNYFTVEGATSVTNSAGSGVVKIVFPATAAS